MLARYPGTVNGHSPHCAARPLRTMLWFVRTMLWGTPGGTGG